jgi:hypothetical protein
MERSEMSASVASSPTAPKGTSRSTSQGSFTVRSVPADGGLLGGDQPVHKGLDVLPRSLVEGHHHQLCASRPVALEEPSVEAHPLGSELRGGDHHASAAGEQQLHQLDGDRSVGGPGDQRRAPGEAHLAPSQRGERLLEGRRHAVALDPVRAQPRVTATGSAPRPPRSPSAPLSGARSPRCGRRPSPPPPGTSAPRRSRPSGAPSGRRPRPARRRPPRRARRPPSPPAHAATPACAPWPRRPLARCASWRRAPSPRRPLHGAESGRATAPLASPRPSSR